MNFEQISYWMSKESNSEAGRQLSELGWLLLGEESVDDPNIAK